MIEVLNVPLYDADICQAVQTVINKIQSGECDQDKRCVSATGAHGLVEAHKDVAFKALLRRFFMNLPDGMPAVWIGRLKGAKKMKRCYGPDFFAALIKTTADLPMNHFFCGGKDGVAIQLKQVCQDRFGNNCVTGTYCPPFRELTEEEMKQLGQQIDGSHAHIVWIGLSTPKQEKFAERLVRYTRANFIITVGAAFDFHTGNVKQAPKWMQKAGLEWFFRLLMEPKRLFRRYSEIVPKFIWLNIKEFMDFYIFKKKHI